MRLPIKEMAQLDFVRWDRFVVGSDEIQVYGWIDGRDDGRSDFVLLRCEAVGGQAVPSMGTGHTTSSERWSREISRRLYGSDGDHVACERVEDESSAHQLDNVVRLRAAGEARA